VWWAARREGRGWGQGDTHFSIKRGDTHGGKESGGGGPGEAVRGDAPGQERGFGAR
jgi:hypothetical protein